MKVSELAPTFSSARCFGLSLLLLFAFFFPISHSTAEESSVPSLEYQLKASLVFNVLHFVTWPEEAFPKDSKLTICQMGPDFYGKALAVLKGKVVQGRSIALKKLESWRSDLAGSCQVVISTARGEEFARVSQNTSSFRGVLTIGDSPNFLEDGGIIKFLLVDNSVKFDINLEKAKQSQLIIGTRLLRLANNVLTSN